MRRSGLLTAVFVLAVGIAVVFGASAAQPQPRAHVYLLRGLLKIFSLGMDSLAEELKGRDLYATVDSYSDWQHSPNRLLPITKLARKHRSS